MSIREYNKDNLREHATVEQVSPTGISRPISSDPLIFWTNDATQPKQVNLYPFALGQSSSKNENKNKFVPFSARPRLIHQIAPAIHDSLISARPKTVSHCLSSLRAWWRVMDAVEAAAYEAGVQHERVEDVRNLTMIHSEFAHRSGMARVPYTIFRGIAESTRLALGARPLYWRAPENRDVQRYHPPEEQIRALRFELKRACRKVLARWEKLDFIKEPVDDNDKLEDAVMYRHATYMRSMQKKYGKLIPTPDELRNGAAEADFKRKTGFSMTALRETAFTTRWDADSVYHLCLCNTGWNPATLLGLDVTKNILFTHPKDEPSDVHKRFVLVPETYTLTGNKARAGNAEQTVFGLWKTLDGPGHLITSYMQRVAPLRELLQIELDLAKRQYAELVQSSDIYQEHSNLFERIKRLEQGCRSIWLYIDRFGEIVWLNADSKEGHTIEKKKVSFMAIIVQQLNDNRAGRGESLLPHVTSSDFRDFFATYVWKSSGGNILAVKRALGHANLKTTSGYLDNNVLNQEADNSARKFLNILIAELSLGRLDLTVLAHLNRYGQLPPESEKRLFEYRELTISRMKIGCRDPSNPPGRIRTGSRGMCDDNRCLLCPENAVLLPESYDGIAMRVEELLALQANLPVETWANSDYPVELQNNLVAILVFDKDLTHSSRLKWASSIITGEHHVPGLPTLLGEDEVVF